MLEARAVDATLGRRPVLHGIDVSVPAGAVTAIVGPNGAGKSILLRLMAGELTPRVGEILLDGRTLASFGPAELARRRAVLPQASTLAFPFTVFEVVRLGLSGEKAASAERIAELLRQVDLGDFGPRLFQELSGGEQQRVHIARVLAQLPAAIGKEGANYLMFDEPTASLDLKHQLMALRTLRRFVDAGGGAVVVLHDLNLARAHADRLVVLDRGRVVAQGDVAILDPALIRDVFGVSTMALAGPNGAQFFMPIEEAG